MKKILSLVLALTMLMSLAVTSASATEIANLRDYQTQANEMETFCIQYSQAAVDLNVLGNCIDGLLTNDAKGALVPNAAKEWSSNDDGQTWTFVLQDGMTWVDYQGNVKADVVAEDWLWGLEWVLNAGKNSAANTSMPIEMIAGAGDYYEYTASLSEDESKALGLDKFLEMVGIATPDEKTIVYTLVDKLAYFPTVATYNCLYPISGKLLEEVGVDGYYGVTYDTLWYSGPYTITSYIQGNEKVFTKNPHYWNTEAKLFDTVTVKMVESADQAFTLFQTGELDYVSLTQANLSTIYNSASNEFHDYLVEARPTKYSYQMHLNWNKNQEDGVTPDDNWNTAVANENFRLALYYGLDATAYLARTNFINPLSCQNYAYTANNVAVTSDGRDYTALVREKLGLEYSNETYTRHDADKAAEYKAKAIEELTAAGVELPVKIDYYISGASQTAKDTADTLAQLISDCLGDDMVVLNTLTYVSSLANEVRNPRKASIYINGWGADFGDPINFLGQETYGEDNAYYAQSYVNTNDLTDAATIALYEEFTRLVNVAKAITGDMDARYEAFAEAEAFMISHALCIPWSYDVSWELTGINDYTKSYSAYGIQNTRYVNWDTKAELYTTEEYEAFAAAAAE